MPRLYLIPGFSTMMSERTTETEPHQAAALVHPQADLLIAGIGGLQSQQAFPRPQAVVVAHHPDDQVEGMPVQHVLQRGREERP